MTETLADVQITTTDFQRFSAAVHTRFNMMAAGGELFITQNKDDVWAAYLAAFPEGTDPIYKTNTVHTCSCCKHFVRNIGNLVGTIEGKLTTIWEIPKLGTVYDKVAKALHKLVINAPIQDVFCKAIKEQNFGALVTRQLLEDGTVKKWNHFHARVPARFLQQSPGEVMGMYRTGVQVFERGLKEITLDSLNTIIELIETNNLYRGAEHKTAVTSFIKQKNLYSKLKTEEEKHEFVWLNGNSPAARFRNTVIGTLAQDLSEDRSVEGAVKAFEEKVAPTNYKRPTALVTPGMIKEATKKITELGIEEALDRRLATIADVRINDVLWADNTAKNVMKGKVTKLLEEYTASSLSIPDPAKATPVTIDYFLQHIAPTAQSIELLVKNIHEGNFVTLTAPVNENAPALFKWTNPYAWSYEGNVTDSIKQRVHKAGGNINAKFRVSLAWFNTDDLDLHAHMPDGRQIAFNNKAGILDVDMNAFGGLTESPVENLAWNNIPNGKYEIYVHMFTKRNTDKIGFTIEVQNGNKLEHYSYMKPIRNRDMIKVGSIWMKNDMIERIDMESDMVGGTVSKEVWNVKTETMIPVRTIMHSPNFWGNDAMGNRHTFFMLDNCKTDVAQRGIYNEFLRAEYDPHRKAFELIGDKTKCPVTAEQLSGVGFSSTNQETVTVRATTAAKTTRVFNISF